MKLLRSMSLALFSMALLGGASSAAQLKVISLVGNWRSPTFNSTSGTSSVQNGDPTSSINWGGTVAQSGYDFTKSLPSTQTLPPSPTPLFPLGTFTHRNVDLTVNGGGFKTLKSVFLDVVLTLDVDGTTTGPLTFTFKFDHDETGNTTTLAQCDQTKLNPASTYPCPDVVTFSASPSPTTFNVGGVNYTLSMSFVDPHTGNLVNRFITEELQSNVADLVAQFTTPATGGTTNTAPNVNAGPDQTITLPALANLSGTASDDGLPNNILTVTWSKVSGPGTVNFGNAQSLATTASFSAAGSYVLRLTASDTLLSSSDNLTVTVNTAQQTCVPNPACQAVTCSGSTCQDICGTIYPGTKTCSTPPPPPPPPCIASNTCAANTCTGSTCDDSCGNSYPGAKDCSTPPPPPPTCTPNNSCQLNTCTSGTCQDSCGNIYTGFNPCLPPPAPVINSFTANPTTIVAGNTSSLSWSISNATSAVIDHAVGIVSKTSGSKSVNPTTTTTYTLTACGYGCVTANALVTVNPAGSGSITLVDPASANPNPVTGTTTHLHVLAQSTNPGLISYQWTVTGLPATIATPTSTDSNVTFTQPGNYVFTATMIDSGGKQLTSSVSVDVVETVKSVVVTPSQAFTEVGQSFPFSAQPLDQFRRPMNVTLSWSSSAGSISPTGSFISTRPLFNVGIRATAPNGVFGTAIMSVQAPKVPGSGSADLTQAKAYPVPFKSTSGMPGITFKGLSPDSSIRLFTIDGHLVQTLHSEQGEPVLWRITNMNNSKVSSGVYIYRIDNGQATKEGKIVVIQ
jgi:hypothetical protein